jgi:transketolase
MSKVKRLLATRDGFGQTILELGRTRPQLMVLSADLSDSMRLSAFKQELPEQYLELGISEQNMAGVAAGLALLGKTVVITSFAAFNPGRNWEQIRLSICEQNLNVKIVGSHAGLATGADGATHQALEDLALMTVLPRMRVFVPADFAQAQIATEVMLDTPGPVYLRLSREPSAALPTNAQTSNLDQGQVLRLGQAATIVACGLTVELALQAASELEREEALSVRVLNFATLKPLAGEQLLKAARETGALVTIEEHQRHGGLGSLVASYLSQTWPVPLEIIGVDDAFGTSGTKDELFTRYGLTVAAIKKKVWQALERKK